MPHSGKKKSYLGVLLKSNFNRAQPSWGLLRALKSKQTGGWHLRITERSGGLLYLISMKASVCTELADSMVTGGTGHWISLCVKCCRMVDRILYVYHGYYLYPVTYTVRPFVDMITPAKGIFLGGLELYSKWDTPLRATVLSLKHKTKKGTAIPDLLAERAWIFYVALLEPALFKKWAVIKKLVQWHVWDGCALFLFCFSRRMVAHRGVSRFGAR